MSPGAKATQCSHVSTAAPMPKACLQIPYAVAPRNTVTVRTTAPVANLPATMLLRMVVSPAGTVYAALSVVDACTAASDLVRTGNVDAPE